MKQTAAQNKNGSPQPAIKKQMTKERNGIEPFNLIEQQTPYLPDQTDSFLISDVILSKIWHRVSYKILEHHVDSIKTDYCINTAISHALATVNMNSYLQYDQGECCPLPSDWADSADEIEALASGKDLFATLSLGSVNERKEQLKNLYEENDQHSHKDKANRKSQMSELSRERKKHLVQKHGSANVVGSQLEPWASAGVIRIKEPRQIENDDELAQKVRDEKQREKQRLERQEREAKDKVVKDRMKNIEIENINKELDKGTFTYDFLGNVLLQNTHVVDQIPADTKFRYKFKKGRKRLQSTANNVDKYGKKINIIPFEENKQTGSMVSDYGKLSKLCDHKLIQNIRQTAGSMFEFFTPNDHGVHLKEDKKIKYSKKDYEAYMSKMSLETYTKKINADGNFVSTMIHPELQTQYERTQQVNPVQTFFPKSQALQVMAQSLKQDLQQKQQDLYEQTLYIQKLRDEFNEHRPYTSIVSDKGKDKVVLRGNEALGQLIQMPDRNQSEKGQKRGGNASEHKVQGSRKDFFIRKDNAQNMKTVEITDDLFKLQQRTMSQQQLQTIQYQTQEFKSTLDELNEQIVSSPGWGHNNEMPVLKHHQQSQQLKGTFSKNQTPNSQFGKTQPFNSRLGTAASNFNLTNNISRPFTRQSQQSSQSIRNQLTTAASQRSQRRNLQILTQKLHKDQTPKHLAPPMLGKSTGHGLIPNTQVMINKYQESLRNNQSGSQNTSMMPKRIVQQKNNNHLMSQLQLKIGNKGQNTQSFQFGGGDSTIEIS